MKKIGLKLSDIRSVMEETYRHIGKVTGHDDIDLTKEQHHSRTIPTPKSEASNEAVLVCWSAVAAASSADDMTQDNFDAGLLLTGHAEPEVTGAIILAMCDRLLKVGVEVGVEAGAFPDISVPLAMLASSIIPDMSDDDRCGHA